MIYQELKLFFFLSVMIYLNDLIQIYDNAVKPDICEFLINFFENNEENQEKVKNDKKPNFTQINLTECSKKDKQIDNIHNDLIRIVLNYKKKYYNFVYSDCFPESNAFEYFRIKRYNLNSDEAFDTHVDVKDYETARRFLCFMIYLNDVEDGGETTFQDLTIKPKKGKLVVFPPMWMFPYCGKEPLSNSKYILSTYLHYK